MPADPTHTPDTPTLTDTDRAVLGELMTWIKTAAAEAPAGSASEATALAEAAELSLHLGRMASSPAAAIMLDWMVRLDAAARADGISMAALELIMRAHRAARIASMDRIPARLPSWRIEAFQRRVRSGDAEEDA